MLKGNDHYHRLIQRYLANDCSPQEAQELFEHLQNHSDDRILLDHMRLSFERTQEETPISLPAGTSRAMQDKILKGIQPKASIIPLYKKWLPRVAAAAVLLLVSVVAYYNYNNRQDKLAESITIPGVSPDSAQAVLPGTDKALLTLADGTVIVLDDAGNGNVANQAGIIINKTNGQVIYDVSKITSSQNTAVVFNTISTPKGGQYQVVLPDGSRVWLNATSSLRFPTLFTGSQRSVDLTGEGYFEIAKNASMPFHVKVNNMDVEVLGTHFNIMAYDNEAEIKTTLLEGSVKVNIGALTKTLKPGEQAKLDPATQQVKVANADTEEAVAWKNGYFQFANEDLKSIMRQFARWYDVDISYEGKERARYFSGEVPRTVNLAQALKVLQLSDIRFRVDAKKIIVLY